MAGGNRDGDGDGDGNGGEDNLDVDVAAAVVDALLAQVDALVAAVARAPSARARDALSARKDKLQRELDVARDDLVRLAQVAPAMAAPFGAATPADSGDSVDVELNDDDDDEPATDENASPFQSPARRGGETDSLTASNGDSLASDTVEVGRDPSTDDSEDSQRLVMFARSGKGEAPLGPDTRLQAGPGLFELRGAPDDIKEIAAVLCAAVDSVPMKDLQSQTSLTMERLLMSIRRLLLLKLVERV